jgi:Fe-S cluster assembly protein SufD
MDKTSPTLFINEIRNKNPNNLLCVFINGELSTPLSDQHPMLEVTDRLTIKIDKNSVTAKPLHLLFLQTQSNQAIKRTHQIIAEANSQLSIIEEYASLNATEYTINITTEITTQANAQIRLYKIQREDFSASHNSHFHIQQAQNSLIKYFSLSLGARSTEEKLKIALSEIGAQCQLYGFYGLTQDNQVLNCHLHVDHQAEQTESVMFYKGILDKKSSSTFKGKVHVHKEAKKTIARQANHNLLLSSQAEASSLPELEINTDDIKCTHGATVGQLDQEALFYLRSRGLDQLAATKLLLHSFAEEVLNNIEDSHITTYITNLLNQGMVSHDYA